MKHVMLYFGSFNPIHKGHIAIAEYVIEQNLCDQVAMIVSPQNPLQPAPELAAELMRFEMVEAACAASRYPDRIVASAVEFLLERPSYTVNTLRFLEQQTEGKMRLSILMGSDLINNIDRWREYQYIIDNYDIYVYPRKGVPVTKFADRIHLLADAPQFDYSSTAVREALENGQDTSDMIDHAVFGYIRKHGLWSAEKARQRLDEAIAADPDNASLYIRRGEWHYRRNAWGDALNDFTHANELDPGCGARNYIELINEILAFRYKDLYNP